MGDKVQVHPAGIQFFEIKRLVKFDNGKAKLLFEIYNSTPVYINNINIDKKNFFKTW